MQSLAAMRQSYHVAFNNGNFHAPPLWKADLISMSTASDLIAVIAMVLLRSFSFLSSAQLSDQVVQGDLGIAS